MQTFLLPLSFTKMCCVYLATGSDPSGTAVAVAASSGPPGGVGSKARRLGRIWAKEPGTGSGRRGARFPLIGLRSRSVSVDAAFFPACCSARTLSVNIQNRYNIVSDIKIYMEKNNKYFSL